MTNNSFFMHNNYELQNYMLMCICFFFHFISNQNQNKIPKLCTIWGLYFKSSYQTRAGSEMPKLTCKINLQSNIGFVFVEREKNTHTENRTVCTLNVDDQRSILTFNLRTTLQKRLAVNWTWIELIMSEMLKLYRMCQF